jgi:hypothetical protein
MDSNFQYAEAQELTECVAAAEAGPLSAELMAS